jgi:dTDP-4-dehydrorhamnose 3,5-epimerase
MGKLMNIIKTELDGVLIIEPQVFKDERGEFVKIFHKDTFAENGMASDFAESFFSVSQKNVIRGMHFQIPPEDHAKLVYATAGKILDVVLDIRKGSPAYGKFISVELSGENHKMVYIPSGFAHGFLSLADDSCMTYLQSTMHAKECDAGIRLDSFGMDWGVSKPIISQRDRNFPELADFNSPFIYKK